MAPLGGLARNLNGGLKKNASQNPLYGLSRVETGFWEGNKNDQKAENRKWPRGGQRKTVLRSAS